MVVFNWTITIKYPLFFIWLGILNPFLIVLEDAFRSHIGIAFRIAIAIGSIAISISIALGLIQCDILIVVIAVVMMRLLFFFFRFVISILICVLVIISILPLFLFMFISIWNWISIFILLNSIIELDVSKVIIIILIFFIADVLLWMMMTLLDWSCHSFQELLVSRGSVAAIFISITLSFSPLSAFLVEILSRVHPFVDYTLQHFSERSLWLLTRVKLDRTLGNLLDWHGGELLLKVGHVANKLLLLNRSSVWYLWWCWLLQVMPVFRHGAGLQAWCRFSGTMLVFRHIHLLIPCRFSGMMLVFWHGAGFQACHRSGSSISISCWVGPLEYRSWFGILIWILDLSLNTILHEIGTFTYHIWVPGLILLNRLILNLINIVFRWIQFGVISMRGIRILLLLNLILFQVSRIHLSLVARVNLSSIVSRPVNFCK